MTLSPCTPSNALPSNAARTVEGRSDVNLNTWFTGSYSFALHLVPSSPPFPHSKVLIKARKYLQSLSKLSEVAKRKCPFLFLNSRH
jgi:hypothetical protein